MPCTSEGGAVKEIPERPGADLLEIVEQIVPRGRRFAGAVDTLLRADGEFEELLYQSTIMYVVRRLVRSAQYVDRKLKDGNDREVYAQLRQLLRDEYSLEEHLEPVLSLLMLALQCGRASISERDKTAIEKEARRSDRYRCYLCGADFIPDGPGASPHSHEHHWPKTVGGVSTPDNIRLAPLCHPLSA